MLHVVRTGHKNIVSGRYRPYSCRLFALKLNLQEVVWLSHFYCGR